MPSATHLPLQGRQKASKLLWRGLLSAKEADKYRTLKVRTNADTPADAKKARELGAEGIGPCRTEHMFFEEDRIAAFREMICSDTVEELSLIHIL